LYTSPIVIGVIKSKWIKWGGGHIALGINGRIIQEWVLEK